MAKTRTTFQCQDCGVPAPQWVGRCAACGAWGSLEEVREVASTDRSSGRVLVPTPIGDVDPIGATPRSSGISELDRVLSGGFVPGSVTLLGGEPGIGKSTLLLQTLGAMSAAGARCMLVTGEESPEQVRLRAERLHVLEPNLAVVAETDIPSILATAESFAPHVLAIDSIQTVHDPGLAGVPGSVAQVRDGAQQVVRLAKRTGITVMLVGHVTKEGTLAGPRVLEHLVDTVLSFEGDRHHALRMMHAPKHRFGGTQELGLFEMSSTGLQGVADPSAMFLADRLADAPGSVVVPLIEGSRPLIVELQALVTPTSAPMPRRSAQGLDSGRLAMMIAVLEQRVKLSLSGCEVYASVAGGVRASETALDLALACAIASAATERPLHDKLVVIGEVGLVGEVRSVPHAPRRLAEAARLGFTHAVVPPGTPPVDGLTLIPVASVAEGIGMALRRLESHNAPGQ
ncbi:MAG: DNA repair protein RadA [Acidimicrobiia bacterium]